MNVRPAKTQISLGIRPVWSESSLCSQCVAKDWSFLHADSEDWSDWADAQADLSLHWGHTHFVCFVMSRLLYIQMDRNGLQVLANSVHPGQTALEGSTLFAIPSAPFGCIILYWNHIVQFQDNYSNSSNVHFFFFFYGYQVSWLKLQSTWLCRSVI